MKNQQYTSYEDGKGWLANDFGRPTTAENHYFSGELKKSGIAISSNTKIIEIGFGNGHFLGWCRQQGISCYGVELNAELVNRAIEAGFEAYSSIEEVPESLQESFDGIVAFDVLEHIPRTDIVSFIKCLRRFGNSKSTILLRFPNGDNPFSYYLQNGDITHVTAVGAGAITQVAALSDLECVQVRGPYLPLRGVSQLRALTILVGTPLRALLSLGLRYLFMGGTRVHFTPNLVAVLKNIRPL